MPALVAHSWWHLAILYVAMLVCFIPEWYRSWFKRVEPGATMRDRGSHGWLVLAISLGVFLAFFFAFGIPETTIAAHQRAWFWVGIALMFAGSAFRHYAIHVLGRFFTHTVVTRADQYVVDTGPYRWVRHPAYVGSGVTFIGLGLALTNWAALLAVVLWTGVGFAYRVAIEERALRDGLGQPYRDYIRRTWRFIPHVW